MDVPVGATSGWSDYQEVAKGGLYLAAGTHVIRVQAIGQGRNLDWVKIMAPSVRLDFPAPGMKLPKENITFHVYAKGASSVEVYDGANKLGDATGTEPNYTFTTTTPLSVGAHTITAKVSDGTYTNTTPGVSVTVEDVQAYPATIPDILAANVEAENYDKGGSGKAYYDVDSLNGTDGTALRGSEWVDLGSGGTGYILGWTIKSEWVKYTFNVSANATRYLEAHVASAVSTGKFKVEIDGVYVGDISIPNTGGWNSNWTNVRLKNGGTDVQLDLKSGNHLMRIEFTGPYSNAGVDYFRTQ
jgi:hypothetical protein